MHDRIQKPTPELVNLLAAVCPTPSPAKPFGVAISDEPGAAHGARWYPDLSGRAFSRNPYAWNEHIEPAAGAVQLLFGLNTRFDNPDDYSRLAALAEPFRRPEAVFDEICRRSQHKADYLDSATGGIASDYVLDLLACREHALVELLTSTGDTLHPATGEPIRALTCDGLLRGTPLLETLRAMLGKLAADAGCEVELDFALNVGLRERALRLTPLALRRVEPPPPLPHGGRALLATRGTLVGRGRTGRVPRLVHISAPLYAALAPQQRYEIARLVGRINRASRGTPYALVGPGRWGTVSPELGIPVRFAEISGAAAVVEIAAMHESLVPEASLGTHFLNDLVARNTIYAAICPGDEGHRLDAGFIEAAPSRLRELVPDADPWLGIVRVVDDAAGFALRADETDRSLVVTVGFEQDRGAV